MQTILQEAVI